MTMMLHALMLQAYYDDCKLKKKCAYAVLDFIIYKKAFQLKINTVCFKIGRAPQLTSKQISLISIWKQ